ncbi:MAG: 23S rRNA (guanosine(2251)-2'-O)-methyltransferase RlmB [Lachnospiraceae bacterium]|nr:23S rRNA (guanosine(2251)-2'-O)-methyltransferase RlmB [Lachnospiraceae bacterium]
MITSAENKKIKNVIHLLEKSKARKEQDAFVSEGIKMFEEAPLSDILEVYVSEDYKGPDEKLKQVKYEVVEAGVFKKMADTLTPQGILCVLKKKHYDLDFLLQREDNGLYLVLETVQDPGNLGTIMRTAEGAGVTGVIMSSDTVDIYNPKTVRSTMGSIFRVPFIYTDDLDKTIRTLKTSGVTCYAAHLKGTKTCYEEDYGKPTAFFIGNEGNGLSEETADLADSYIKIPMGGKLESLNAAVSAAILMYEAKRQRL